MVESFDQTWSTGEGNGKPLQCRTFLPFHTVHGVLKARILKWFALCSPVDHILSEYFSMTHLSWVALHGMAHSFIELDKAVVHGIILISFL